LLAIWSTLLDTPCTDPTANFFELGGDSITALRAAWTTAREFGIETNVSDLLLHPTAAGFARLVEQRGALRPEAIPANPGRCEFPLSVEQEGLWFVEELGGGVAPYGVPFVLRLSGAVDVGVLLGALRVVAGR
ncbi:phosphopantetheine-binding protein, partial [Streptomyces cyaneofuscatus]|uniref:phosphopantetheine-binding protein n=1 Tax=Streptomyces cyaneofuscatus TaxID=66883 RepID=UPI000516CCF3